jgi:hypothetical protein
MCRRVCAVVLGLAVGFQTGCGPQVTEVTGTVTYNGEPPDEEGC